MNSGDPKKLQKIPPAIIAQLMGITEEEVKASLHETNITLLGELGISYEGRDPDEVMDEFLASLLAETEKDKSMNTLAERDQEALDSFLKIVAEEEYNDLWLVFEGDWGGQIYLTVPVSLIGPQAKIVTLLRELDKIAWDCNDGDGKSLCLYSPTKTAKRLQEEPNCWVSGGMGGGKLLESIWLHDEFNDEMKAIARELLDIHA